MLEGDSVVLRDQRRADVEAMYVLAADVRLKAITDEQPWLPRTLEQALQGYDKRLAEPDPEVVGFTVASRDDPGGCLGSALLWGLNQHQRTTHLGITLLPQARGRGLGTEVVALLCQYAFQVRDLVRVQLETLASNVGMQRAAEANGFVLEGRLRQSAWVMGGRDDDLVYGLLAEEWRARTPSAPAGTGTGTGTAETAG